MPVVPNPPGRPIVKEGDQVAWPDVVALLGQANAALLHDAGWRVYASARCPIEHDYTGEDEAVVHVRCNLADGHQGSHRYTDGTLTVTWDQT